MAPRRTQRIAIHRSKAEEYKSVAENFFGGAEVAKEYAYWNASGVLIVHAAIALADALAIKFGGVKNRGEDHHDTIALLEELIAPGAEMRKAMTTLRRIIDHKNAVSYSGNIYSKSDIDQLWRQVVRFKNWADQLLK